MRLHVIPFLLAYLFGSQLLYSQCLDGNQPQCECETAPVLCTIDDLDGYQFSMDDYQHPWDGPDPLCSGAPGSVPNNPTWFAFQAWCTEITLDVMFDNCVAVGGVIGVQIAVYSDCDNFTEVSCNVSPADCNTADKQLTIAGMEIGNTYYFLVDGCLGSYCDVTIEVVGTCGAAEIDPFVNPIAGETLVCAGNTETYTVDDVDGANTFHWYVDGVEIAQTEGPGYDINWGTPGSYELCVDVSSDPCIPATDPPDPICTTIEVFGPDPGEIAVDPNPLCPGEVANITVTGYAVDPDIQQAILIVDESGTIVQVTPGDNTTFTHDECAQFVAYSYNFVTAGGLGLPSVGDPFSGIDCGEACCELDQEPVVFEDSEAPVFDNPPADMTVACLYELPPLDSLGWTDNCDGSGQAGGTEDGPPPGCDGGTIMRTWEYTDGCGNTATHTQSITVEPLEEASFSDPPGDQTVGCEDLPLSVPDLDYTNGGSGDCLIDGSTSPTQTGSADICGGNISFNWEFTDTCGRTISHTQNITVESIEEASFINAPGDLTVGCDAIPSGAPDLNYSNNGSDNCLISGSVPAVQGGTADFCGGSITYNWDYTDTCGRVLSHQQIVTVDPAPEAAFINPPADVTVDCNNIPASAPDLSFSNGQNASCLIEGSVPATQSGSADLCGGTIIFTWEYTDDCGRTISHSQNVTVDPAPEPAFINPPGDITVSCDNVPTTAPDLMYSNGGSGDCLIEGTVSAVQNGNADVCGMDFSLSWEFTDACGRTFTHIQNVIVLPAPLPDFDSLPGDITIDCDADPMTFDFDLGYDNGITGACNISGQAESTISGNINECGGQLTQTWEAEDQCGRIVSHQRQITVNPAPPAAFNSLPPDITIACAQAGGLPTILTYSNGASGDCGISGNVTASQSGGYNECGGTVVFSWEFTDACGRTISHSRSVTVEPSDQAGFINPPADVTLSCDQVPAAPPTLDYSNGESGACGIDGSAAAIQTGNYDACGGMISWTWNFTDNCGRTISHSQNITVEPAPDPAFTNPPADVTLDCGMDFPTAPPLDYSNGASGNCLNSGSAPPVVTINDNLMLIEWSFTNTCNGDVILHQQTITRSPTPDILLNPVMVNVCQGGEYDLSLIEVNDLNGTDPQISFHSATPAGPQNQLPSDVVTVQGDDVIHVLATNSFGCTDETPFFITADAMPDAGTGLDGAVCNEDAFVSLFDFLGGSPQFNGSWFDFENSGIDISNPNFVYFFNETPDIYTFHYIVPSGNSCPADTAVVNVELLDFPSIVIDSIACSADNSTYYLIVQSNGYDLIPSVGDVIPLGANLVSIQNIPIESPVTITILDNANGCAASLTVNPPDCDCPSVDPPLNDGNAQICADGTIPLLSATVGANETANWYADPDGNTLLLAGSTTYQPTVNGPGIYTFHVEAESLLDSNCRSNILTPVQLQIRQPLNVRDSSTTLCDDDNDGLAAFDLEAAAALLTPNAANIVTFHDSKTNAENGLDPLPLTFTNTQPYNQLIYALITDPAGCDSIVGLELIVYDRPEPEIEATAESCAGAMDGQITVSGGNGWLIRFDGMSPDTVTHFDSLDPADYSIVVTDSNACTFNALTSIEEGLQLGLDSLVLMCNDNGTESDSGDDFYRLTFVVSANPSSTGQFQVLINTADSGHYAYGQTVEFQLPANGPGFIIQCVDTATGCVLTFEIGPLDPCSTSCEISVDEFEFECDDNETPADGADDFYSFVLNASALNGSTANTFLLLVNGAVIDTLEYGLDHSFTLQADGSNPTVLLRDSEDAQCSASLFPGELLPCSDECVISASETDRRCDDNGSSGDASDDLYFIEVEVNGLNASGQWQEVNTGSSGSYGQTIELGPFPIAEGDTLFSFVDSEDDSCRFVLNVTAPPPCSDPCELSVSVVDTGLCNDNGTGADASDDFFQLIIRVDSISGTLSRYTVDLGSMSWGPFTYGEEAIVAPLPADGSLLILEIGDINNPNCPSEVEVSLDPCSECTQSVEAGPDQTLSCDVTNVTLSATSSMDADYQWTGPGGFSSMQQQVDVDMPGLYIAEATFPDGCSATDSLRVLADVELPEADAGPDRFLNCLDSLAQLEGQIVSGSNILFSWLDEDGMLISSEPELEVSDPGSYFLVLTDTVSNCVSPADEVVITGDTDPPSAQINAQPADFIDCTIQSIILSGVGEEDVVYTWINVGDEMIVAPQVEIFNPGLYQLHVIDTINGCENEGEIFITALDEYPFLEVADPPALDCQNQTVELDATASQQGPDLEVSWYDGDGHQIGSDYSVNVDQAGTYIVLLSDETNGCQASDTLTVEDHSAMFTIDAGEDISLDCSTIETQLQATGNGIPAGTEIIWTSTGGTILSGASGLNPQVSGSGIYVIELFDPVSLCTATDSVEVMATPPGPSAVSLQVDSVSCFGASDGAISILEISGGTEPVEIIFDGNNAGSQTSFELLSPGEYILEIIDANGCTYETSVQITEPPELTVELQPFIQLAYGESGLIEATASIPDAAIADIIWVPADQLSCDSCLVTEIIALEEGEYMITLTDRNGCMASATIRLLISRDFKVYIPNAITPNGDFINDGFTAYGNENVRLIREMKIFDRWGEKVFERSDIEPNRPLLGWDGYFDGEPVLPGVYAYWMEIEFADGSTEFFKGEVHVVR